MNERIRNLLSSSIKEQLSKDEFLLAFEKTPDDFCALRVNELEEFITQLVLECSKFSDRETELRKHFGIK